MNGQRRKKRKKKLLQNKQTPPQVGKDITSNFFFIQVTFLFHVPKFLKYSELLENVVNKKLKSGPYQLAYHPQTPPISLRELVICLLLVILGLKVLSQGKVLHFLLVVEQLLEWNVWTTIFGKKRNCHIIRILETDCQELTTAQSFPLGWLMGVFLPN